MLPKEGERLIEVRKELCGLRGAEDGDKPIDERAEDWAADDDGGALDVLIHLLLVAGDEAEERADLRGEGEGRAR